MPDDPTKPDGQKGEPGSDDLISRDELKKVIEQRDRAKDQRREAEGQLRSLQARLDELEAQLTTKTQSAAKKSQNVDELEASFRSEIEKRDEQLTSMQQQLRRAVIDQQVLEVAGKQIKDADLFLKMHRDDFDVKADEHGNLKAVVKNSVQSLDDFVSEFAENRPTWKIGGVKSGTGTTQPGQTVANSGVDVPRNWAEFTHQEKVDWMRKNAEVAKKLFK